jgi:hypothetical protein
LSVSFDRASSKGSFSPHVVIRFFAGAHPGRILELPDQSDRDFLVQIKLTSRSLVHVHKVFGEMIKRT